MKTFLFAAFLSVSLSCSAAPELVLVEPNGGELLAAGTTQTIRWEPADQPVNIWFSPDGGSTWAPVTTAPATALYAWTVPAASEAGMVMIQHAMDPSNVWDISDDVFIIYTCSRTIAGDINGDCYVDLLDVAEVAANWLVCSNPYDLNCPCAMPFADCDAWAGNGCEVNLSTDVVNCGTCSNACNLPHAYMDCINSECVLSLCHPGYFDCDGDPSNGCEGTLWDAYENNNTFALARNLGTIPEFNSPQSWTAQIVPEGDEDWYRVYLQEGAHSCFPGVDQDYVIRVILMPPQGASCVDYDVQIYDDSGPLLKSGQEGGCTIEDITHAWDGSCGTDDSRYFRIRVFGYGGAWNCTGYTLHVDMYAQ